MRHRALAAFLLCISARLNGQPVDLTVSSLYEWPERTEARGSLKSGDLFIQMKADVDTIDESLDLAQATAIAVTLPWMRLGPLRPTGVMREAANPLGFTAGSGVFSERTGLSVKGSLPAGEQGFLCMPVPEAMGCFCVPLSDGGLEYGCFGSLAPRSEVGVEGFTSLSQPPAAEAGDEWYCTLPPYPGGCLLDAAGRLLLRLPALSIAATAGFSSGEKTLPGMFGHLRVSGQGSVVTASLLIGGADAAYRTPEGEGSDGMLLLSAAFEAALGNAGVKLGYSVGAGHPELAPGRVLPTREKQTITLTRLLPSSDARERTLTAEAGKSVNHDAGGCRTETAHCNASFQATGRDGEWQTEAGWSDDDGWAWGFSCASATKDGLSLGLEAGLGDLISTERTATALARIRARGDGGTFAVSVGLEECPLTADAAVLAEHVVLRVSWTRLSRQEGDPDGSFTPAEAR